MEQAHRYPQTAEPYGDINIKTAADLWMWLKAEVSEEARMSLLKLECTGVRRLVGPSKTRTIFGQRILFIRLK